MILLVNHELSLHIYYYYVNTVFLYLRMYSSWQYQSHYQLGFLCLASFSAVVSEVCIPCLSTSEEVAVTVKLILTCTQVMNPLLIEKFLHLAVMKKKKAITWGWTDKLFFPQKRLTVVYPVQFPVLFPSRVPDSNGQYAPWPLRRAQLSRCHRVQKRQEETNVY